MHEDGIIALPPLFFNINKYRFVRGFTLKGDNDWKLHKFHHDAPVRTNFRTHYGVDNTGDIYVSDNIRSFASVTDQATNGVGLDLITADGVSSGETML